MPRRASFCRLSLVSALLHLTNVANVCGSGIAIYTSINSLLCINSQYVESYTKLTNVSCANQCSLNQRCQAFTTADGPCQLFVFDKCSKSVRDCSCSRRGQVFMKGQPGLPTGALCPTDYGDDLCGTKYKMHDLGSGNWFQARQKCESESGLTIMADVTDVTELNYVSGTLYNLYAVGNDFWLGGFQTPGSPEPAGGWNWVACNLAVNATLWATGEPNHSGLYGENAIGKWSAVFGLTDMNENLPSKFVLCECVSPFN